MTATNLHCAVQKRAHDKFATAATANTGALTMFMAHRQ